MPRIPFPIALTIGTDVVHTTRIQALIGGPQRKRLLPFVNRVLHPLEVKDLDKRYPWWRKHAKRVERPKRRVTIEDWAKPRVPEVHVEGPSNTEWQRLSRWLGGRWASKEAARKAWGADKLGWKDVRVEVMGGGAVQIVCAVSEVQANGGVEGEEGAAATTATGGEPLEQVAKLSISHDGEYVVATVLAAPLHGLESVQKKKKEALQHEQH